MTINTDLSKRIYAGNGVTTEFDYDFKIFLDSDLRVSLIDADGNETVQVLDTDYTVDGAGFEAGGSVTFMVAPGNDVTVLLMSNVPYTQPTDLKNQGRFFPETLENAYDRATRQILQLREQVDRSLTIPAYIEGVSTDLPAPEVSHIIGWNSAGTALRNYAPAEFATIVAYADKRFETFSGDSVETDFILEADPGSLGNLAVSIDGVVQTPGVDFAYAGTTLTFTVAPPAGVDNILVRYDEALPTGVTNAGAVNFTDALAPTYLKTVSDILNGQPVSLFRFINPAHHAGIKAETSTYDCTSDVQDAFDSGAFGLEAPYGRYRLTAPINAYAGVRMVGAGVQPHVGGIAELNARGKGTWFWLDHAGVGFNVEDSGIAGRDGQAYMGYFGTYRTRTDPTGTLAGAYVPLVCDPDIVMNTGDLAIEGITLLNPTTGIRVDNAGRLYARYLRGQPLLVGIDLVQATDACRIRDVHWWPFWSDNDGVRDYQVKTAKGFRIGRADNPSLTGLFTIGFLAGVECYMAAGGRTSKLRMQDCDFDLGQYAFLVDAAADGAYGVISNVTAQCAHNEYTGLLDDMSAFDVKAPNNNWLISNVNLSNARGSLIRCSGASSELTVANASLAAWNQASGSRAAVDAAVATATIHLDKRPHLGAAGIAGASMFNATGKIILGDEFAGYFSSDGTTTVKVPTGWSVSRLGAGNYAVTHNLGMPSATDSIPAFVCDTTAAGATAQLDIANTTGNGFRVRTYVGGVLTDCGVFFKLKRRPVGTV